MPSTSAAIKVDLAKKLLEAKNVLAQKACLIGFDGMVDEIIHIVSKRTSKTSFSRVETIEALGNRVLSAAGKSSNLEMHPLVVKIGGNGPLMSMATAGMGCQVTCLGVMGYPNIWPVFEPLQKACAKVISIGDPGHTDALEFTDGKIMLGKVSPLSQVNWARITEIIGEKSFSDMINQSDLVGCTSWTMLIEMEGILEKIISLLTPQAKPLFFFDLADPEKREVAEIKTLIEQIKRLNTKARCILGLNLREAEQIAEVLGLSQKVEDGIEGLKLAAAQIAGAMGIHGVVIHSVAFAGATVKGETQAVEGPFCAKPSITTGAGDHFNGGFCSGQLAGLSVEQSLLVGVATSGWYVRNGGPNPKISDVAGLLETWAKDQLN